MHRTTLRCHLCLSWATNSTSSQVSPILRRSFLTKPTSAGFSNSGVTRVGVIWGGKWWVSPYFFLEKIWRPFSHRLWKWWPFSLSSPRHSFSNVVYPAFFINSATKNNFRSGVTPLEGVTRDGPFPRPPPEWRHCLVNFYRCTALLPFCSFLPPFPFFPLPSSLLLSFISILPVVASGKGSGERLNSPQWAAEPAAKWMRDAVCAGKKVFLPSAILA